MAFKTTWIGSRIPSGRTYLEAVARVMRACGEDAPTSVTGSPPNHVMRARGAVDDALQHVYNAALWDFRRRWAYLALEDYVMWYQLPGDWAARGSDLLVMVDTTGSGSGDNSYPPVKFVDYGRFIKNYPDLPIPTGDQVPEGGLGYSVRVLRVLEEHTGAPEMFFIHGDHLGVYPVPSFDAETDNENFQIAVPLLASYWGLQKDLTTNDELIPLPVNLLEAHHNLALARYKQSLEYSDFQMDEARGERALALEVAKMLQHSQDTQTNHVSEWGVL